MATNFKSSQAKDGVETNESQNAGGGSVAGVPAQRSVRNGTYQTQRHNFSVRAASSERVPSAGWRAVYRAMEVTR